MSPTIDSEDRKIYEKLKLIPNNITISGDDLEKIYPDETNKTRLRSIPRKREGTAENPRNGVGK